MQKWIHFRFSKASLGGTFIVGLGAAISVASCSSDEDDEPISSVSEALTVNLQEGVNGYVGTTDTYIQQGSPTTNNGAATTCHADGDDGGGNDKSCLIRWSISGIPAGSTVTSATITLNAVDGSGSNTYNVYALNRTWNESQATWNVAQSGTNWGTPGAMAASDRGAVIGTVNGSGSRIITLNGAGIALVQGWINGGTNAGVIIAHASVANGIDFASSEHGTAASRPKLTINYTAPGGTGGTAGTGGSGTGNTGNTAGTAGTGNTGNTGGGGATDPNLLIAFIADQGANSNSTAVLQLVENEGAAAAIHAGDFDYGNNPTAWDDRITSVLGANYPYFATVGNHDGPSWNGATSYGAKIAARQSRAPSMQCVGDPGVKQSCNFRGLRIIQTCVGVTELSNHGNCAANSTEQINYLSSELANDSSIFTICSWHKNQNDMQVGTKGNEVGWNAYTTCMNGGGIIANGHEHSYSRTFTLTNLGNTAAGHGKTGVANTVEVGAGRTFVFVSGLAGNSVRAFDTATHNDDTWWASYYTSDRWYKNGVMQSGTGTHGALFIRFNVNGNPRQATAYFKDVNGRLVDEFTINAP